jgi:hypothetical protein
MKTTSKLQKIGSSKGARRICLWSLELNRIGLTSGTPITLKWEGSIGALIIERSADKDVRRKVSRVMNHGKELPVIDLKETKSLSLAPLGEIGDKVNVEFREIHTSKGCQRNVVITPTTV